MPAPDPVAARTCCVPRCERDAPHRRDFTVVLTGWGGEIGTDAYFCCEHIDMLNNEEPPFLDLTVIGTVRDA